MQITEVKKVIVSCLALVNDDNEILFCKRSDNSKFSGCWEFPGGKIKKNETPQEGLIREIKEEIGVDLNNNCIAPLTFSTHICDDLSFTILLFISRKWKENQLPKIHSEIVWLHPKDIKNYKMLPNNNYLISSVQDLLL